MDHNQSINKHPIRHGCFAQLTLALKIVKNSRKQKSRNPKKNHFPTREKKIL